MIDFNKGRRTILLLVRFPNKLIPHFRHEVRYVRDEGDIVSYSEEVPDLAS
jgi:hypothetical protein